MLMRNAKKKILLTSVTNSAKHIKKNKKNAWFARAADLTDTVSSQAEGTRSVELSQRWTPFSD